MVILFNELVELANKSKFPSCFKLHPTITCWNIQLLCYEPYGSLPRSSFRTKLGLTSFCQCQIPRRIFGGFVRIVLGLKNLPEDTLSGVFSLTKRSKNHYPPSYRCLARDLNVCNSHQTLPKLPTSSRN